VVVAFIVSFIADAWTMVPKGLFYLVLAVMVTDIICFSARGAACTAIASHRKAFQRRRQRDPHHLENFYLLGSVASGR